MSNKLIYIADDEINICKIIKSFLTKAEFNVEVFLDGESLLNAFNLKAPDMLILDLMMPKLDGYELCSIIRSKSSVPIIFISAKDTETDKIKGLSLGGDDYLTKPFSPLELIARIQSIFRRIDFDIKHNTFNHIYKASDLTLNTESKQAMVYDTKLELTSMEFSLLCYLVQNRNKAVSRNELLNKIWNFESDSKTRATDDMIKRIRKKLSLSGSLLKIETIRGFGFIIKDDEIEN